MGRPSSKVGQCQSGFSPGKSPLLPSIHAPSSSPASSQAPPRQPSVPVLTLARRPALRRTTEAQRRLSGEALAYAEQLIHDNFMRAYNIPGQFAFSSSLTPSSARRAAAQLRPSRPPTEVKWKLSSFRCITFIAYHYLRPPPSALVRAWGASSAAPSVETSDASKMEAL